LPLSAKDAL